MTQERESKFRLYSKGVVVYDKPAGTHLIQVTPMEDYPYLEDPLREWGTEYDVELPDAHGVIRRAKATSQAYIEAEWLALHQTNRISSPDVVHGEMVDIYRYSDSEKYYWDKCRRDEEIRKLEHVIWAFNDSKDFEGNDNPSKQYRITVSTRDKLIEIRTVTYDDEPVEYVFRIDTGKSMFTLEDSRNNSFVLNSLRDAWTLNARSVINIFAPSVNISGDNGGEIDWSHSSPEYSSSKYT